MTHEQIAERLNIAAKIFGTHDDFYVLLEKDGELMFADVTGSLSLIPQPFPSMNRAFFISDRIEGANVYSCPCAMVKHTTFYINKLSK